MFFFSGVSAAFFSLLTLGHYLIQVEEFIQEDSRVDQYPKLVKGEQKVVWEWQGLEVTPLWYILCNTSENVVFLLYYSS